MDEAACNALTSLHGDVVYCKPTVRQHLGRLAGHGGAQCGWLLEWSFFESVDPNSRP